MLNTHTQNPFSFDALAATLDVLKKNHVGSSCLWAKNLDFSAPFLSAPNLNQLMIDDASQLEIQKAQEWRQAGWDIKLFKRDPFLCAAYIIADQKNLWSLMREARHIMAHKKIVVPADGEWIVSRELRHIDPNQLCVGAKQHIVPAYIERANLTGCYVEFGTFCGQSFYRNYHMTKSYLKDFYAFDSFQGLSTPLVDEHTHSRGDFAEGEYFFDQDSFCMVGRQVEMDLNRLRLVPGWFAQTLRGYRPEDYGLSPKSVSFAAIDCDLFEPTYDVLNFIEPALDDGALLYFDDWFLTRASPRVGERGAALKWLSENPQIELVEFAQTAWQNKFFIFHRR